jgi:hypothetical protein
MGSTVSAQQKLEDIVCQNPGDGREAGPGRPLRADACPDYPSLENGRKYVLFLRAEPHRNVSAVVGGNQGTFVIDDGYAEQAEGEITAARGKLPLAGFKEEIRQLPAAK